METNRFGDALRKFFSRRQEPQGLTSAKTTAEIMAVLPDATPEEVKARREASATKHSSKGNYTVEQELVIPNRFHTGEAWLAPLAVTVNSYGGGSLWTIVATLFPTPEEVTRGDRSQPIFGKIQYEGSSITTEEALKVASEWVRDSSVWVPNEYNITVPAEMAAFAGTARFDLRGN